MAINRILGTKRITANARVLVADTLAEVFTTPLSKSDTGAVVIAKDTDHVYIIKSVSPTTGIASIASVDNAAITDLLMTGIGASAVGPTFVIYGSTPAFVPITGLVQKSVISSGVGADFGVTTPNRYTINGPDLDAPWKRWYRIDFHAVVETVGGAATGASVTLNKDPDGANTILADAVMPAVGAAGLFSLSGSALIDLAQGDDLEFKLASGTNQTINFKSFTSVLSYEGFGL